MYNYGRRAYLLRQGHFSECFPPSTTLLETLSKNQKTNSCRTFQQSDRSFVGASKRTPPRRTPLRFSINPPRFAKALKIFITEPFPTTPLARNPLLLSRKNSLKPSGSTRALSPIGIVITTSSTRSKGNISEKAEVSRDLLEDLP